MTEEKVLQEVTHENQADKMEEQNKNLSKQDEEVCGKRKEEERLAEEEEQDSEQQNMIKDGLSQIGYSASGTNQVFLNLELQGKELDTLTFLCDYKHIQVLDLSHNNLEDLSMLSELPHLISLNVSHNKLSSILDFTPPLRIREMNFSNNLIKEINGDLSIHKSLGTLLLDFNQVEEIKGIEGCVCLRNLSLSNNKITKISGLENLSLKQLDLSFNCIKKIENISSLKVIQYLNLCHNDIRSLRGLQNHDKLEEINLANNQILDVSEFRYLRELRLLRILNLSDNPIQEIADYRISTVFKLSMLVELDGAQIKAEEKIHSNNYFNASKELVASRDHMYNLMKFYQQPQTLLNSTLPVIEPYPILIITAPKGMQKEKLAQKLCQQFPDFLGNVMGHTTYNLPRQENIDEDQTDDYCYVTEDEFEAIRFKGEFIQTYTNHGSYFGVSREMVDEVAQSGLACVLTMDLEGVMGWKQTHYEPRVVMVLPKDTSSFKEQLLASDQEYSESQIEAIMNSIVLFVKMNQTRPGYFDDVITGDSFDECLTDLQATVSRYLGLSSFRPQHQQQHLRLSSINSPFNTRSSMFSTREEPILNGLLSEQEEQENRSASCLDDATTRKSLCKTPAQISYIRRFESTRSMVNGESPKTPSTPAVIPYVKGRSNILNDCSNHRTAIASTASTTASRAAELLGDSMHDVKTA